MGFKFEGTYTTTEAANAALGEAVAMAARGEINLVSPGHHVYLIPAMRAVSVRSVAVAPPLPADAASQRPAGISGSLYPIAGAGQSVGPTKETLRLWRQLAGISLKSCDRVDDGGDGCVCEFRAIVTVPSFDGGEVLTSASYTNDLRDGSPQARKAGKGLDRARQNLATVCESKAMSRAIADALGVKRGGPNEQMSKPWVFAGLVQHVDLAMMSEAGRDALIAATLGVSIPGLFGRSAVREPPMAELDDDDREGTQATQSAPAPQTQTTQGTAQPAPAATQPRPNTALPAELKAELKRIIGVLGKPGFEAVCNRALGRTDFATAELNAMDAATAAALAMHGAAACKTGVVSETKNDF